MKTCIKCGICWPLCEFYIENKVTGRTRNSCIYCERAYGRDLMKRVGQTDEYRIRRSRYIKRRRHLSVSKEHEMRHSRIRKEKYPQKVKAMQEVRAAISRGLLIRPSVCSKCGTQDPKQQNGVTAIHAHHHNGYDNPLDVQWLCITCHTAEHRKAGG
jgi:hypothetical protein